MKQLSVVIAAGSGPDPVQRCVLSLEGAEARERCEVIVAARSPIELPEWVRILIVSPEHSYPALRAAGLAAAQAPLVAVLSEDYTVDADWLTRALAAGEADVVSGLTRPPSHASLAARAAWLWEYVHLAPPLPAGLLNGEEAALAPAGNVVYRRSRVAPEFLRLGDSELEYHRALYAMGMTFTRDPWMVAIYNPPGFSQFVRDRARWSYIWAKSRAQSLPPNRRKIAAVSRALLPPLLLARFAAGIARKPHHWLSCLAACPMFVIFACAQAYGEARAYLEHG
jgi:hypothetical protein